MSPHGGSRWFGTPAHPHGALTTSRAPLRPGRDRTMSAGSSVDPGILLTEDQHTRLFIVVVGVPRMTL